MNEAVFMLLVTVLLLVAVAFVVIPLIRPSRRSEDGDRSASDVALFRDKVRELERDRDVGTIGEADYVEARFELEQEALQDLGESRTALAAAGSRRARVPAAIVSALVLAAGAVGLYARFGDIGAVNAPREAPLARASTQAQIAFIKDHLADLEQRAQASPKDGKTWTMLARVYMLLGQYGNADEAFGHLRQIVGDRTDVMTDQAEAAAMAAGSGVFPERARKQVEAVLEKDPNQPKALWLAGVAAASRQRKAQARSYWERLLAQMPQGSESATRLRQQIAGLSRGTQSATKSAVNKAPAKITVTVTLDPRFRGRFKPDDSVFVFARAVRGPRAPLAVKRGTVKDLPMTLVLNDAAAVVPGLTLSRFPAVQITARVSRFGGAGPQPGDVMGTTGPVEVSAMATHQVEMSQLVQP